MLVDLGHHAQGTNIEYIVATLLSERKLGGFHLNNRKYADDDLTIASINPYEVFLIFKEIVFAWRDPELSDFSKKVVFMFDQAHITKPKILAMVQSVVMAQELFAKALLVDENRLREAQKKCDVVEAEETLMDAFRTDVRSLLREYRKRKNLPEDPIKVFREGNYMEKRRRERR